MSTNFRFCGVDGSPHDNNIIRCPKCLAINPILRSPSSSGDIIDLSSSPPPSSATPSTTAPSTTAVAPSTAVFATADRFRTYDRNAVDNLRQTPASRPPPDTTTVRGGSRNQAGSNVNTFDVIAHFYIQYFVIDNHMFYPTLIEPRGKISCIIIIYYD
jgi:hypothetical protein